MIVFFSSSSTPWYLTLFVFAVSLVSQGLDITYLPYSFMGGPTAMDLWREGRSREEEEMPGTDLARLLCLGLAVTLSLCICRFFIQLSAQIGRVGIFATIGMLWTTPLTDWPARWFFANEELGDGGWLGETHGERLERVSKRVQQLPTEEFMEKEDMERLPLRQLKEKLYNLGLRLKPGEVIDRNEAIKLAMEIGGSSSITCAICCEDFASGELLRKLPACGHRFHLECVDKWLYASTDYSQRKPCCPMCKAEI